MLRNSVWVGLCAVVLVACGGGGSGKLSGTVQFAGGGDASGVTVRLAGGEREQVAVTAADGAYAFEDVGNGTWALGFEASDTLEGRKGLAVVVKDGKVGEVPAVVFTAASTVTGKVTAGGDTGNLGIQVAVAGTQLVAVTADDGSFTLEGVPSGQQVLVATRGGYVAQSTVTVARGTFAAPAFALGKQALQPGTLAGTLRYWDMRSSTDITLSVPGLVEGVHPAADGSFRLALPAGTWELVATAPSYPRQVVARASVTADAVTDVGVKVLSAAYRFAPNQGTQTWANARLLGDGVHVLLSREAYNNVTHSIANLTTGTERPFLVEWEWLTDGEYDWTLSSDGHFAVYARNLPMHDEGNVRHTYPTFHVIDTTTGALRTVRGEADASTTDPTDWSFSADGAVFFGRDTRQLHRIVAATGEHTAVRANVSTMKGDAEHYLVVGTEPATAPIGTATFVTKAGAPAVLSTAVQTNASMMSTGAHALLLTDCDAGTQLCAALAVDLKTGATRTVAGGGFSQSSGLYGTTHPAWARIEGVRSAFVRLSTGEAFDYAPGFTSAMADSAVIDPAGDRVAFYAFASPTYSLFLAPMPFTAVPTVPVDTGTESYSYTFLAPGRFVATTSAASRLIRQTNDTRTDVTAADAVAGSVHLSDVSAAWRRASDKAFVAVTRASATPVQLTDADPDLKLRLNYTANLSRNEFDAYETKGGTWNTWTVFDGGTGRFYTAALKAGTTSVKRIPDVRGWGDGSATSILGGSKKHGWSDQDVVVDLETGVVRQLYADDVTDWEWGVWSEEGTNDYLMLEVNSGRTVQMYSWNDPQVVYEAALLKY